VGFRAFGIDVEKNSVAIGVGVGFCGGEVKLECGWINGIGVVEDGLVVKSGPDGMGECLETLMRLRERDGRLWMMVSMCKADADVSAIDQELQFSLTMHSLRESHIVTIVTVT
jgi:hypothetical protein